MKKKTLGAGSEFLKKIERNAFALRAGSERDRWKAAIELGGYVETIPELLWSIVVVSGSSRTKDLQVAVATCLLEHILQVHFDKYFPEVRRIVLSGNSNFFKTFQLCSRFGQAELKRNVQKWKKLERDGDHLYFRKY